MFGNGNEIFGNAVALLVALGGFEFIKYLLSLKSHKKKEEMQAKQEEAVAGQNDADLRQKELDLLNGIISTTKAQFEELRAKYEELLKQSREDAYKISQNDRRIRGLERAFQKEVIKKKQAELHYCGDESCPNRKPKMGDYQTDTIDIFGDRDDRGRFVKRRITNA